MKHGMLLLFLSQIAGIGRRTLQDIDANAIEGAISIDDFTAIANILANKNKRIHMPDSYILMEYMKRAEAILTNHEKLDISMITKYDVEYPQSFADIPMPAPYFFIKGKASLLKECSIGVIGTRQPSNYGRNIAMRLGEIIADYGISVISGLAEGCDTAAHIGCINRGGKAVAVIATPLDKVYPVSNTNLFEQILSTNGCIISEYPVGTETKRYAFVERDRLQCGLADGIIVAETGEKGGTLHGVNGALRLKKPVACISYNEDHYNKYTRSRGNMLLIESGKADALTNRKTIEVFIKKCQSKQDDKKELISLF